MSRRLLADLLDRLADRLVSLDPHVDFGDADDENEDGDPDE